MAEAMLGHTLANIAAGGGEEACALISTKVGDCVLSDPGADLRALKLVLQTMNGLRRCFVTACATKVRLSDSIPLIPLCLTNLLLPPLHPLFPVFADD